VTGERDAEDIVVTVAVRTDAFAESLMILLGGEFRVPVTMRGFELYEAS
jgi:hypothetical protein